MKTLLCLVVCIGSLWIASPALAEQGNETTDQADEGADPGMPGGPLDPTSTPTVTGLDPTSTPTVTGLDPTSGPTPTGYIPPLPPMFQPPPPLIGPAPLTPIVPDVPAQPLPYTPAGRTEEELSPL